MSQPTNLPEKIKRIEENYRPIIAWIIKPLVVILISIGLFAHTAWFDQRYLSNNSFKGYIEKQEVLMQARTNMQIENDKIFLQAQKEVNLRLDTIIQNQGQYTEQLRAFNQLSDINRRTVERLEDRMGSVERDLRDKN